MTRPGAAGVPHYVLYGEPSAEAELDLLHVEPFRLRSGAHGWAIQPHAHPDRLQILWVGRGGGGLPIEDRALAIPAPGLAVIPPATVHQIAVHPGTQGFAVTASPGCFGAATGCDPALAAALQPGVLALAGSDAAAAAQDFATLQAEFAGQAPGRRAAVLAQFLRILVLALRVGGRQGADPPPPPDRDQDLVARYRGLLDHHFRSRRTVGFHAGELAVTPARLTAACKARAGRTAQDLLHDRILTEAKRYLLFTDRAVAQVAHLTGFDDPAYFNRFFARRTGLSPGAFRRAGG